MPDTEPGNPTPVTRELDETALREMSVGELRKLARAEGISSTSSMRKEELVTAISHTHRR